MKTVQEELREVITELRDYVQKCVKHNHERKNLRAMIDRLDRTQKRLDVVSTPVKVLIAVHGTAGGGNISVVTSTAPVMVVSVDHRPLAGCCLHAEMAPTLAIPTEFIEAVSDEAAPYMSSCNAADQLSVLSLL